MRIVIDLQAAQSKFSRFRGIGRFSLSLARSIALNKGKNEIVVFLNGLFNESIDDIRKEFFGILPDEAIKVWYPPKGVEYRNFEKTWLRKSAELAREIFIEELDPDIILICSFLNEGFCDEVVSSVKSISQRVPVALVIYDLIPLLNKNFYFKDQVFSSWYKNKIKHVKRSDLLLAISESSRQESIKCLNFSPDVVENIGAAVEDKFCIIDITNAQELSLRNKYNLRKPFVMYTGGIEHRKNVESLIYAYRLLKEELRKKYQLVIVCSIDSENRKRLQELIRSCGLSSDEVIFTGFVSETDLLFLYNLCKLFIFPSWHEGFGLPVLEAMNCGAPVIASNTTSLPEVIGNKEALFDPYSESSISEKLFQALTDEKFRERLIQHQKKQLKKFSWDISAKRVINIFDNYLNNREDLKSGSAVRHKLAFVSPFPPEKNGIGLYSEALIFDLYRYYDIDLIVHNKYVPSFDLSQVFDVRDASWFLMNFKKYDRVLYHFGNSHFHEHMYELLMKIPGVVVLHDFFLSNYLFYSEIQNKESHVWTKSLYYSHGYNAVKDRFFSKDINEQLYKYPSNKEVIDNALGIIAHSNYSSNLAKQWYGEDYSDNWSIIPHLSEIPIENEKIKSRKILGFKEDDFIICSFGFIAPTKLSIRILKAWMNSSASSSNSCRLIFVGQNHGGDYGKELFDTIQRFKFKERITITGWVESETFHHYLAASDMAIQLRSFSRGETSGAVAHCMSYAIPTIVNANGSFGELPRDSVYMLDDDFSDSDLEVALDKLWKDEKERHTLGELALKYTQDHCSVSHCAAMYYKSIEKYYEKSSAKIINSISDLGQSPNIDDLLQASRTISNNKKQPGVKKLIFDITGWNDSSYDKEHGSSLLFLLFDLLNSPPKGYRVEPVYFDCHQTFEYRYAQKKTSRLLGIIDSWCEDNLLEVHEGDIFIGLQIGHELFFQQRDFFRDLKNRNIPFYFILSDILPLQIPQIFSDSLFKKYFALFDIVASYATGVIGSSSILADFVEFLPILNVKRSFPLLINDFDSVVHSKKDFKREAQCLIDLIFSNKTFKKWIPDSTIRFLGADFRFGTHVGERRGKEITTTEREGLLIYGPWIALDSGEYIINTRLTLHNEPDSSTYIEAVTKHGEFSHAKKSMKFYDSFGMISFNISLKEACTDFEIRVMVSSSANLTISSVEIVPI